MDKYMIITYGDKKYKKLLDENLEKVIREKLGENYIVDNNGCLIREGDTNESTVAINREIFKVFIDVIQNYELDDSVKNTIINSITEINSKSMDKDLIMKKVDEMAYLYTFVSKKNKQIDGNKEVVEQSKVEVEPTIVSTPKIANNTDLSKEILSSEKNTNNNITLAKQVLLRASKDSRFSKYINENNIDSVMSKIIVCKDLDEFKKQFKLNDQGSTKFDSESDFNMRMEGMKAFQNPENGKIILKPNCGVDTIVHEIVHAISVKNKETGILKNGKELLTESSNWKGLDESHITALNEAMTHYITRELLPELEISSAYNYGADFLDKYVKATNGYEINQNNILEAYFNQDKNALEYIANDIDKSGKLKWPDVIESSLIYQAVNMMILPFRYLKKCHTKEELDELMIVISNKYKLLLSNSGKLNEFHQVREEYAKEEYKRINRIQQVKANNQNMVLDDTNYVRR